MTLILATLTGLLLGAALALCWEWLDRRIRSSDDLEQSLGLPVLAYIPELKTSVSQGRNAFFNREVSI